MDKIKTLRYIIPIIFLVVAFKLLYPHINDLQRLYQFKNNLNYFWIVIAILAQVSQYVEDGFFTKSMFRLINFRIKLWDTVRVASLDVFATRLFPLGQLGPLAATIYFYHKFGIDYDAIIFLNLLYSLAGILLMGFLLIISLPVMPFHTFAVPVHLYLLAVAIFLLLIFLISVILMLRIKNFYKRVFAFLNNLKWFIQFKESLKKTESYKGLFAEHKWKFLMYAGGKNLFYYLADIITLEACFLALHISPHISLIIFAYILSQIAGALTLIPAGLGSTDAALGIIFLSTTINPAVSVVVIILYRLISLLMPFPLGALSYYSLKHQFSEKNKN